MIFRVSHLPCLVLLASCGRTPNSAGVPSLLASHSTSAPVAAIAARAAPPPVSPAPAAVPLADPELDPYRHADAVAVDHADPYAHARDLMGTFGLAPAGGGRSIGTPQLGYLLGGVPVTNSPYLQVIPYTGQRGFVWGTQLLVDLLYRSAQTVAEEHPGSVLRIGNLSRPGGGDIPPSVSHNSGRDADIAFFAYDRMGRNELPPSTLVHYDETGVADWPESARGRFEFDTARNWTLVRRWLSDPDVVVQWIFVSVPLRNLLLDHALRIGEPETLRLSAQRVLVEPKTSSPHADHFHLRIACPPDDRPGCIDGPGRTSLARDAQVDALLHLYRSGSPAEQRYAREMLSLPTDGADFELPPIESED
ncbi:MAG: penicillin-insensitive murein endopeptidase [Myxococcota bacterium]